MTQRSTVSRLTPTEVVERVDHHGGLMEAAFGFGITALDIDQSTSQGELLAALWQEMEATYQLFATTYDTVRLTLDAIEATT